MLSRTAAANATATEVRTGAVLIRNARIRQFTAAAPVLYLQIFNVEVPTVGTTAPVEVIRIPAKVTDQQATVTKRTMYSSLGGLYLDTGFAYAVTTTHDGNTAPDAGDEPEVEINYEQR